MAEKMQCFYLGDLARVGAEIGLGRWQSEYVTLQTGSESTWRLQMSATTARSLARKLKRTADFLDPPKPRPKKA